MAHYQNSQYSQHPHSQPPLPPLPVIPGQPAGRSQQGYESTTPQNPQFSPNATGHQSDLYPSAGMARHPTLASRQDAELFMSQAAPPLPPPPSRYNAAAASSQSAYNPQDYASHTSPTSVYSGTSPVMGRRPSAPGSHQAYNPADYAGGAPGYQYSPGYAPAGQQQYMSTPPLHQSPVSQRPHSVYNNNRPTVQTSYSSHYGTPGPPPLPAIPSAGDSPGEDWGTVPSLGRYSTRRYQNTSQPLPSPPPNQHSRTSSTGMSSQSYSPAPPNASPGMPPPLPPPHHHHSSSLGRTESLASRPLPSLPAESPGRDEFYSGSSPTRYQKDLENQIVSLANGTYDSDSEDDPEALAGLMAFEEAERQEAEDAARRASGQTTLFSGTERHGSTASHNNQYVDSDSDVPAVDLSMMGGGWDAHMSYGGDPNQLSVARNESTHGRSHSQTVSSSGSFKRSGNASDNDPGYSFSTGGLYDPNSIDPKARRLSFDEGDEAPLVGEPPEMFYHPGITNRPLPQLPPEAMSRAHSSGSVPYPDAGEYIRFPRHPSYPTARESLILSPPPGRHTSLVAHSSTPPALTPTRAITDAEQRRRLRQPGLDSASDTTAGASAVTLGLPEITKRYNPSALRTREFEQCMEPWALSGLASWLKQLAEDEQYLKKQSLVDGLVALFTHKVPTMNIADAETLADTVIEDMQKNGTIVQEEEWLVFKDVPISGVIFQLTGAGCYAPKLHNYKPSGRCYSYHCQRTERKIDLSAQGDTVSAEKDWVEYWNFKKEDMEKFDKKEIARQNILHELVQKEENYLKELGVLLELFRDSLAKQNPPVIPPKKLPGFLKDVFGKAAAVKKVNEEYLLPQMKYQQQTQGPWIVGFSGIFREWIRKAKIAYIEYASAYPQAVSKVRHEMERNMLFRKFLNDCQADKRSRRLDYNHYLKLPLTRLQQIILLLDSSLGKSTQDNEEKRNLIIAIEEIKQVTHECDARVGEAGKKEQLVDLQSRLRLREEMKKQVNLHLDHLGRELIYEGDLLRAGSGVIGGITRYNWLETHAILFDHYLVLAKTLSGKDGTVQPGQYDVSRFPIPMDLLVLESDGDDPVKYGLMGVNKVEVPKKGMRDSTVSPLQHSTTSTSLHTMGSSKSAPPIVTAVDGGKDDKILYPFKVKHLGKELYTLYAHSAKDRDDWCSKIIEAKTKHAHAHFTQNAEPFKMRVIADTAFAYDGVPVGRNSVMIKGTPIDRAIREVEAMYVNHGRPGPVCRAKVNCATSFVAPGNRPMVAIGTDYGVYVSEENNPRGWQKTISNARVKQIAVLEDFSIFLLISDKSLIAYHLDIICPPHGVGSTNDANQRAPQKLSGNRDVGFFATARMKDRVLVFYKKKDVSSSTFKVLEPVLQRSTEKRSRFPPLRSGKTEFFRDFDDFYIPTECVGMNVFHSAISVSTVKGFEILNLDRKQPMSIPTDIEAPHTATIAQRIKGQEPRGMFRLSEQEFLLCFETCAVYVNKHGDINRSAILEFVGRANSAALFGENVLLFDNDFVEIRNAMNGRLQQVITGRDVKCLDSGENGAGSGRKSVKISMMHPEFEKNQIVVELVLNEGKS